MPLSAAEIQTSFKHMGKFIHAYNQAALDAQSWRGASAGTDDQLAGGADADYDIQKNVVRPFHSQMDGLIGGLDAFPAKMRASVTLYLKHAIAASQDLTASASPADILDALIDNMNDEAQTVGASGSFADGFQAFFVSEYSKVIPSSGSPTCLDAWITDAVV